MQNFHQTELTIFLIFVFHHLEKKICAQNCKTNFKERNILKKRNGSRKKLIFILGWELCHAEWVWTEFDYGYGRTGQEI